MIDDLKSCSVCGNRLASKWSKGDLVHYCAYCAVAERSDDAPALREIVALRARAEAAEAEVERLRAVITKAVDDLPEWSDGALKRLSPAEVMADEVRMALRAAVTH